LAEKRWNFAWQISRRMRHTALTAHHLLQVQNRHSNCQLAMEKYSHALDQGLAMALVVKKR